MTILRTGTIIAAVSLSPLCSALAFSRPLAKPGIPTQIGMITGNEWEDKGTLHVALTRERGKNSRLEEKITAIFEEQAIKGDESQLLEIPCIAFEDGPDTDTLPHTLTTKQFDYICITSPEAATVFANGWQKAKESARTILALGQIAAVGKATEHVLKSRGFEVSFVPTKATAKVLVQEISPIKGQATTTILYPASEQAQTTLQDGLQDRGSFEVTRLNTYNTVPAVWTLEEMQLARQCHIACFGSPSAVKAWISNQEDNAGDGACKRILAACIGETSATACRNNGWNDSNIFYPKKPGLDGWARAVLEAAESIMVV
jgi:uroporphyrinogen-III synthase